MSLPPVSNLALKEWAVATRTLGRGDQIMILRKGGIHRDDRDFRLVHPEFVLYPTYEHQREDLVKPEFHATLAEDTHAEGDICGLVRFSYFCRVTDRFEVRDESALDGLSAYHIWTEDYARKRLHWRPKQPLTVALLRVYEMRQPYSLPVLAEYSGCKSWVELGQDVPLDSMSAVLSDAEYERRREEIQTVI